MLFRSHPQPRLRDKVAERQRRRQLLCLAQLVHPDLLQQEVQRGVIERQMVSQQQQQPAPFPEIIGDEAVDHRRGSHVEAIMSRIVTFRQLFGRIIGFRVQNDVLNRQFRCTPDHLYRFRQAFPGHGSAQDIMACYHRLQGPQEPIETLMRVKRHQDRHQVGIPFGVHQVMKQNAFLQRRQRIDVLHVGRSARHGGRDAVDIGLRQADQRQQVRGNGRAAGRNAVGRDDQLLGVAAVVGQRRQPSQRRRGEQFPHVGVQPGLAHARDEGHGQQRMPAQFEEIIVAADLLDLEQLGPEGRQGLFGLALRRFIAAYGVGIALRRRQGFAVQLAVRGQRQRFEVHEGGGHHVFGQRLGQMRAQAVHRHVGVAGVVGHQLLAAGAVLAGQHRRFADRRVFGQPGLDLAQLDAEAADLDLEVVAAQEFDAAVGQPAAQVAGLVQPRLGIVAERILDKALGGQLGPVQVTTGDAVAGDMEFAGDTDRNRFALSIEEVDAGVGHRLADGDAGHLGVVFDVGGRAGDGGFGGAVGVDQFGLLVGTERFPGLQLLRRQRVTGHVEQAHAGQLLARLVRRAFPFGHQGMPVRRGQMHEGRATLAVHAEQPLARHQRRPGQQRREDLFDGQVEIQGVLLQDGIGASQPEHLGRSQRIIDQGLVFDHHALGLSGRAGGVDDVGQMMGCQAQRLRVRVGAGLCRPGRRVGVEQQAWYGRRAVGEARGQTALYQHHHRGAVGQHVGQPVCRIGRVQRHVGAAGFENGQQADDHVRPALGADRDPVVGLHAQAAQMVGQLIGFDVEPGVAQPAAVPYQGFGIGCLQRLGLEQFMGAAVLGIVGPGGVPAVKHLAALGLRQDADPVHGGVRCAFQGSDQVFQRRVHQGAQLFRRYWRQGLRGQRKPFAQVVHIQSDRVVGALFARQQDFDALPGGGIVRRGVVLAMPVVEQCAEQRRRRLHAATALRQAQRRMFMPQQAGQPALYVTDLFQDTALGQLHSQRQGVDEHSQHPLAALAALHAPKQ